MSVKEASQSKKEIKNNKLNVYLVLIKYGQIKITVISSFGRGDKFNCKEALANWMNEVA